MSQNTKIIGLIVGVVVMMGGTYYLLRTPNPVYVETMQSATSTEEITPQESLVTASTSESTVPEATTTISSETKTTAPAQTTAPSTPPTVPKDTATPTTPAPTPVPVVSAGITMSVVATHNNENSCWSAIDGKVYDLTSYIPKHPGGKSEILGICGKDGSSMFNGQHGGDSKPERVLAGFYLNIVAN